MKQGVFITLEGNDGAGKTTVCMGLRKELEARGYSVVYTREPGGSKIAEEIRNILLSDENENMDPRTEALLFAASRRQHLVEQSDFHKKVRQGYETLIQMYPDRICVIDAEPEPEVVLQSALHEVLKVIQSYE